MDGLTGFLNEFKEVMEELPKNTKDLLGIMRNMDEKIENTFQSCQVGMEEAFEGLKIKNGNSPEDDEKLKKIREEYVQAYQFQSTKMAIIDYLSKEFHKHQQILDDKIEEADKIEAANQMKKEEKKSRKLSNTNYVLPPVSHTRMATPCNCVAANQIQAGEGKKKEAQHPESTGTQNSTEISNYCGTKTDGEAIASGDSRVLHTISCENYTRKKLYCFCNLPEHDLMILCENEECPREWFHMKCVDLDTPPEGKWYCPACSLVFS